MTQVKMVQVTIEVPEENGVISMSRDTAAILVKGLTLAAEVLYAAKDEDGTEQMIEARDFIYGMYTHCWDDDGADKAEYEAKEIMKGE